MNEEHRTEIEELLNDLVEGTATERQETEFKRLAKHEPEFLAQLNTMRRQKELLNSLPFESAPDSLVEDVRSALERKQILGNITADEKTIAGTSHLLLRRILTTAAMFLLPVGLLSFVVYEIMKPASVGPTAYVSTGETLSQEKGENLVKTSLAIDKELPFNGTLTFTTNQQITVSNYIEKMVFDNELINFSIPNRTADTAIYQITAPSQKVAGLVSSLEKIWPHCQGVTLSVANSSGSKAIEIPQIQVEQIIALTFENDQKTLDGLANQYARTNMEKDTLFAIENTENLDNIDLNESPRLTMPILTGNDKSVSTEVAPSQPMIQLEIHVKSSDE